MQQTITLLLITAIFSSQAVVLHAQPAPPPADPAPEKPDETLAIVVTAFRGTVQVREAADQPWKKVTVGMPLQIGWDLRTGLRSVVQFRIGTEHAVTIDRLGVVKVLDARRTDGKIKTDIGLKYGRTNYKVKSAGEEHESKIHAPSATLAIRGSNVTVGDDDAFGYSATVSETEDAEILSRGDPAQQRVVIRQEGTVTGKQPPTTAYFEGRTGQPVGPALLALLFTSPGANPDVIGGRRDGITPFETALTVDELAAVFKDIAQFPNGPSLQVLTDIRTSQDQASAAEFEMGVDPGSTVNTGQLFLQVNWSGFSDIDFGVQDSLGAITAPFPDTFGPGANTVTRPGGPATGTAGPDQLEDAMALSGNEFVTFNTDHLAGNHVAMIRFIDFPGATAANFDVTVTQQDPVLGTVILLNQTGVIDAANSAVDFNFNVPATMPPGQGGP